MIDSYYLKEIKYRYFDWYKTIVMAVGILLSLWLIFLIISGKLNIATNCLSNSGNPMELAKFQFRVISGIYPI